MVQVEKYVVPSDRWTKHMYFPKDLLKGIILGRNVEQNDYDFFKNYILECGYDPNIITKVK